MGRTSDFSKLKGVALIEWKLKTATLLCIKSGTTSLWEQSTSRDAKMRQVGAKFDFFTKQKSKGTEASLSDFYYDTFFKKDKLQVRYCIPASSFRGAIRSYTIKRLVPKQSWSATDTVKKERTEDSSLTQDEKQQQMTAALNLPGWHLVQNLFGIATDSADEKLKEETVAGRLTVSVGELDSVPEEIFRRQLIGGDFGTFRTGSTHGNMVITTRNPLDRVTQAAKDGGLHSFMELAPGNVFTASLRIVNPSFTDLGLVAFWEKGIQSGLLRIGRLTSLGRGRLTIDSTKITIFTRNPEQFLGLVPHEEHTNDRLNGVFKEYTIGKWHDKKQDYLNKLRNFYDDFTKEA
jgi:CRISPR/Cas system CSM-associated protein Csm3 (group 7 of RAMP superfamily)